MTEKDSVAASTRRLVVERAQGCCEYCLSQARYCPDPFPVEHIYPASRGDSSDPDNLALSCQGCNNAKFVSTTAVDPVTDTAVPLFHPRAHRWEDHFAWSHELTHVIGLTATGRATVLRLRLNREGVVNLREVLAAAGKHPPEIPRPATDP